MNATLVTPNPDLEVAVPSAFPAGPVTTDLTRSVQRPSFETIYRQYSIEILRFVRRLCQNRECAEELTQETFLRAFRSYDRFQNERPIVNWLMRIAKNAFLDRRRFESRRPKVILESELSDTNGLNSFIDPHGFDGNLYQRDAVVTEILHTVEALGPDQRELFRMAYVEELPFEEIAGVIGVSVACVRSRLFRIRNHIRAVLLLRQQKRTPEARDGLPSRATVGTHDPFRSPSTPTWVDDSPIGGLARNTHLRQEGSLVRQ